MTRVYNVTGYTGTLSPKHNTSELLCIHTTTSMSGDTDILSPKHNISELLFILSLQVDAATVRDSGRSTQHMYSGPPL